MATSKKAGKKSLKPKVKDLKAKKVTGRAAKGVKGGALTLGLSTQSAAYIKRDSPTLKFGATGI